MLTFVVMMYIILVLFGIIAMVTIFLDMWVMSDREPKKKKKDIPEEKPKILELPNLKPITCQYCRTKYEASTDHIQPGTSLFVNENRLGIYCPVCKGFNKITFEEVSNEQL